MLAVEKKKKKTECTHRENAEIFDNKIAVDQEIRVDEVRRKRVNSWNARGSKKRRVVEFSKNLRTIVKISCGSPGLPRV